MIAIGNDHAGINLKNEIINYLKTHAYEYIDLGAKDTSSVDYPDFAEAVSFEILSGKCKFGILICGTGIGISISANKIPGIRAALCTDSFMAKMCREHNNCNILALGERVIGAGTALDILESFLSSEFQGGRHQDRLNKISNIEKNHLK